MLAEGLTCAINACHMGITAEEVAARYNVVARRPGRVRRREPAPRRARRSQDGRFADEIVPVDDPAEEGRARCASTRDEYPRPGTTVEKLAALKPAFKKDGTVTAGNASGINDGAAALVVTTAEKAQTVGTPPLARILAYASTGVDPKIMGIGPVPAVRKVARARGPEAVGRSICSS